MGMSTLTRKSKTKAAKEGVPFWAFFGAEDDGAGGEGQGDQGDQGDQGENDNDDDDDTEEKSKVKLSSEAAKRRRELRKVEKERDDLLAEREKEERKKNDDLTNSKKDIEERDGRIGKLEATLRNNLLDTAILKDPKREWHDSSVVMAALDMTNIEVNLEEGTVEGLSEELARVAKEKAFLVKAAKGADAKKKDGEGTNEQQQKKGPSGQQPGGAGQQVNQKLAQRQELEKKFPALRR